MVFRSWQHLSDNVCFPPVSVLWTNKQNGGFPDPSSRFRMTASGRQAGRNRIIVECPLRGVFALKALWLVTTSCRHSGLVSEDVGGRSAYDPKYDIAGPLTSTCKRPHIRACHAAQICRRWLGVFRRDNTKSDHHQPAHLYFVRRRERQMNAKGALYVPQETVRR